MAEKNTTNFNEKDAELWMFRREMGIADNDKDGWKNLVYCLVKTYLPDKLALSGRERMVMALMGHPDIQQKRGPKVKWDDPTRLRVLGEIDELKAESKNNTETDLSIIERHYHDGFDEFRVSRKTFQNQVSKSRKMKEEGKL